MARRRKMKLKQLSGGEIPEPESQRRKENQSRRAYRSEMKIGGNENGVGGEKIYRKRQAKKPKRLCG
jgi:hypothetical protein